MNLNIYNIVLVLGVLILLGMVGYVAHMFIVMFHDIAAAQTLAPL